MKFTLEFSEAVCEIDEAAAGLSEDQLMARLKGVNIRYCQPNVVDEHGGLRHRVVAGIEPEQRLIDLTDTRISQFETGIGG